MDREFPKSPLVGVGAVVFDETGQVLLVRRASEPNKGRWSLPGGLVELGESLITAVTREIEEETGIIAVPQAIVEVVERIYKTSESSTDNEFNQANIRFHYIIVDYWCRSQAGVLRAASDASDACWADSHQLRQENLYSLDPVVLEVIEKALSMAQAATKDE